MLADKFVHLFKMFLELLPCSTTQLVHMQRMKREVIILILKDFVCSMKEEGKKMI